MNTPEKRRRSAVVEMAGEILAPGDLHDLAASLTDGGVRVAFGDSSHYRGGEYLSAWVGVDITIESAAGPGEFLVTSSAKNAESLVAAVTRVSEALQAADIRHCFEVYDGSGRAAQRLAHRWSEDGG